MGWHKGIFHSSRDSWKHALPLKLLSGDSGQPWQGVQTLRWSQDGSIWTHIPQWPFAWRNLQLPSRHLRYIVSYWSLESFAASLSHADRLDDCRDNLWFHSRMTLQPEYVFTIYKVKACARIMCCEDGLRELLNEDASLREKLMPAMSDELLRRLTGEKESQPTLFHCHFITVQHHSVSEPSRRC